MTSPAVAQAAASTRRPEDVLAARAPRQMPKCCPFCGADVPLAARQIGPSGFTNYIVGCENDECHANPQVSGRTVELAWARWNGRAA